MPFSNVAIFQCELKDFSIKMVIKIYVDNIYDHKNACPICRGFENVVYKAQNSVGVWLLSLLYIWCFGIPFLHLSVIEQDMMETALYTKVHCNFPAHLTIY